MSEEDWLSLRFEAEQLFSPSTPIDEDDLFAGRQQQRSDIIGAVLERGRHAIVYGERGAGKTSLVNTFYRRLHNSSRYVWAIRAQADPSDSFT
jgi:predicted ATPase